MAKYHKVSAFTIEAVQWTGKNFEEVSRFCDANGYFCTRSENDFTLELRKKHGAGVRIVSTKEFIRFESGFVVVSQPQMFQKMFVLESEWKR